MSTYDINHWYDKWSNSTINNTCIIRVTNKCNEQCPHCCFRSGPNNYRRISQITAQEINTWIPEKIPITIMGGELTILTNYPAITTALAKNRHRIRIVTNGQWSKTNAELSKFIKTIDEVSCVCDNVDVVVSGDYWRSNRNNPTQKDFSDFTTATGVNFIQANSVKVNDLVPLGRAWDNSLITIENNLTIASCKTMPSIMVIESGMIGRCPFGYMPWKHFSETNWDEAQDYIWGWRSEKLAEGMICDSCMQNERLAHIAKLRGFLCPTKLVES